MTEDKMTDNLQNTDVSECPVYPAFPGVTGGAPLPKMEARQLAYTVRVLLTTIQGKGLFNGEVPPAYDVRLFEDGSIVLTSFRMPKGVVMAEEVDLPAPITSGPVKSGRSASSDLGNLEAQRKQERRRPSDGPKQEANDRRTISSSNGFAEVYD